MIPPRKNDAAREFAYVGQRTYKSRCEQFLFLVFIHTFATAHSLAFTRSRSMSRSLFHVRECTRFIQWILSLFGKPKRGDKVYIEYWGNRVSIAWDYNFKTPSIRGGPPPIGSSLPTASRETNLRKERQLEGTR